MNAFAHTISICFYKTLPRIHGFVNHEIEISDAPYDATSQNRHVIA